MERETITEAIADIYEYFRLKTPPTDGQIDKWFEKTGFIPSTAVPWIVRQITDMDSIPRNLPREIIRQWYQYLKKNPDKVMIVSDDCKECFDSTGLIHFSKLDKDYNPPMRMYYVALCQYCENYKTRLSDYSINGGVTEGGVVIPPTPKMTKQMVIDNGFELVNDYRQDAIGKR